MGAIASQITNITVVYSTVYSGADQRKHKSSASLAFVRGIHRRPVNCPHKWPVTRKMFPFDDVIMGDNELASIWCCQTNSKRYDNFDISIYPQLIPGFNFSKNVNWISKSKMPFLFFFAIVWNQLNPHIPEIWLFHNLTLKSQIKVMGIVSKIKAM